MLTNEKGIGPAERRAWTRQGKDIAMEPFRKKCQGGLKRFDLMGQESIINRGRRGVWWEVFREPEGV